MDHVRIEFSDGGSKRFFQELLGRAGRKTLVDLSQNLGVSYGSLRMWFEGHRSIPKQKIVKWCQAYHVNLQKFEFSEINLKHVLRKASEKGINKLRKKLGKNWSKKLARKSMAILQQRLSKDKTLREKLVKSRMAGLTARFGNNCFSGLGKLGGRASIRKMPPEELSERFTKMFRNSFRRKIKFDGQYYRSLKEIEVLKILQTKEIQHQYEPKILGYYPDFFVPAKNLIIEVVGFDWSPHIERTVEKIKKFSNAGFNVVVYTYPNLINRFSESPALTIVDENALKEIL